eukprot:6247472-Karenia_brevis.AAC.1
MAEFQEIRDLQTSNTSLNSPAFSAAHPLPDQQFPVNNRLRMSHARRFKLAALGIDVGSGP